VAAQLFVTAAVDDVRAGQIADGCAEDVGGHLERHPAVAAGALRDRGEQVAGVADVGRGDGPQRLLDADLADGHRVDLVVVGVGAADCGGEDGRVGGDADDRVFVDQRLKVAAADAVTRQVVEPDGDPGS
jgi:hypothetical protein